MSGEMLWHAAAINPEVIHAADFSRNEDLSNPIAMALHAQDFALGGAISAPLVSGSVYSDNAGDIADLQVMYLAGYQAAAKRQIFAAFIEVTVD